jgi:hypothetical protein
LVKGEWVVPEVKCGDAPKNSPERYKSRAAVWIGMWGESSSDSTRTWLPQIGTLSQCLFGFIWKQVAVAELRHGGNQPEELFNVSPGEKIIASIHNEGPQPDGRLKFVAHISSPRNSKEKTWWTDPGVQEKDAAWQGGCIVEDEQDAQTPLGKFKYGGLAKFPIPIEFRSCNVNNLGIDTYSGSDNVFRWDMYEEKTPPEELVADTGPRSAGGVFWVKWLKWR